jgi:hypothetical protein
MKKKKPAPSIQTLLDLPAQYAEAFQQGRLREAASLSQKIALLQGVPFARNKKPGTRDTRDTRDTPP